MAEAREDIIQLTAEKDADLAEAEAELARGELATDEEIAAVFGKYRRPAKPRRTES